jgi:hypothetical protein
LRQISGNFNILKYLAKKSPGGQNFASVFMHNPYFTRETNQIYFEKNAQNDVQGLTGFQPFLAGIIPCTREQKR